MQFANNCSFSARILSISLSISVYFCAGATGVKRWLKWSKRCARHSNHCTCEWLVSTTVEWMAAVLRVLHELK